MEIRPIADGVLLHTSYSKLPGIGFYPSNGLVVLEGKDAYLVDMPWRVEDTQRLLDWLAARDYRAVASFSTHYHDDRSAGIPRLREAGVATHAAAMTNELLRETGQTPAEHDINGKGSWLLPDRIYAWYPGPGHTRDNMVVWLPEYNLLVGGCMVRAAQAKGMGNTADADLQRWAGSVTATAERFPDIKTVVPGHGEPGGPELFKHTLDLLAQLPD